MALDRQIDFSGGLNTRIPAHKLPENMVQAATNVDFSHGDIRPDIGIGGDGGGDQFYYEKGSSWVSKDGIGGQTAYPIKVIETSTTELVTIPLTDLGNPLFIKETGTYIVGEARAFTTATHASNNRLTVTDGAHGYAVNDTIKLTTTTTLPAGLALTTLYYVKTIATAYITVSLAEGGSEVSVTGAGTGTHTITSSNNVIVNNTFLSLGAVSSFVEFSDDLYMGRTSFQITATTITSGSTAVTLTAADAVRVIVSDSITGAGIPKDTTIETINYGTNIITLNKPATANGSSVLITINTTPVRLIDGILNKIYSLEIPKPEPLTVSVSQVADNNTARAASHSINWFTDSFPIPFQYGIARFDDATGAEAGISDLSPIDASIANIDSTYTHVPTLVKYRIDKNDANSEFYGKFALYRVGGTSSVIKKVQDMYLTSQTDGSPLSVDVERDGSTTTEINVQVSGLPSGAEWKVKWYGYGTAGNRRSYTSKSISSITIANGGSGYTTAPTIAIAAPTASTGGKQATATAVVTSGVITNVIVTERGSGYEAVPAATLSGGGGSSGSLTPSVVEAGSYQGETTLFSDVSTVHKLYGSDAAHSVDLHFIVKFTSDGISPVTGAPYSDDTREYIFASTNVQTAVVTGDDGVGTHDGCGSYIDFIPPRALIEIEPINDPASIPYNLKHLTEFNNFFLGSVDKRLHISNYAKPNSFSIDGYMDFDSQITGIISRGGEAAVFTEYGLYRVYGNAHNEMRKVQVPTVHGLPVGADKTIAKVKDAVMYISHAGICYFDGRNVTVLTDKLIQDFTKPSGTHSENVAGVIDDTYYLLAAASDGWKVDMRDTPRISNSTSRASNLHYRGVNNRLYSEAGYIGGADIVNKFSFETRDFTGGNITAEKAYYTVYVTGSDFSGTVNIKCDGTLVDTYNYPSAIAEFNRALSISTAKVANRASIEFTNCTGKIASVSVKYDNLTEQQKKRFNHVTLTYTGTPTVIVKVDSVTKIDAVTLTNPGTGNTGTSILYFPAMTEGHIPHITTDETETSRVSGSVFDAEVI
jgi:hypothetical protein